MFALLTLALALLGAGQDDEALDNWPTWRGPLGTGFAPRADPPTKWSETEHVRWKVALPGQGHSSPVVWDEHVFLTTAVPVGDPVEPAPDTAPGAHDNAPVTHHQRFEVLAVDRDSGRILWRTVTAEALPHERAHVSGTFASPSPVTDGELVVAFFGSHGLTALNFAGEVLWKKDLGDMRVKHAHGEGSSPVLHGDTLIVNWDHEGPSFVVALDKRTGEERWRKPREEVTSWSTPIVVEHAGRSQVVVSGSGLIRAYDLETGAVIWQCGGLSHNVVASPVATAGLVIAGSSYEHQMMLGILLDGASGDLTRSENLAWVRRKLTPYVPSPLLTDEALYFLHHYQGTLSRLNPWTGEEPTGPFRLAGIRSAYASPVAAAGRIYVTGLEGTTVVLSAGSEPTTLATNRLDEGVSASAALVGRDLFLRGEQHLYCIAED